MFDQEEMQMILKKAVEAVNELNAAKTIENAREADYRLTMMRLAVKDFDSLHWFVAAEREVKKLLDSKASQLEVKDETLIIDGGEA